MIKFLVCIIGFVLATGRAIAKAALPAVQEGRGGGGDGVGVFLLAGGANCSV